MQNSDKNKFLIDGFPRDPKNVAGWNKFVGDSANPGGIVLDCPEAVLQIACWNVANLVVDPIISKV